MGFELLRLLLRHPGVELFEVTSRGNAGSGLSQVHPALSGFTKKKFVVDLSSPKENDVIFVAAPHGASMEIVPELLSRECKVIDLSGDYRLSSAAEYEKWYGKSHSDPGNIQKAVYGLTELFREEIAAAKLLANPGCYPTGAILALAPAAMSNAVDGDLVIDSKSGTSGAGISPADFTHHPACDSNVIPYKVGKHRHTPEIANTLKAIGGNGINAISFTPHLVPLVRGIQTSCYFRLSGNVKYDQLIENYRAFADKNEFVQYLDDVPKISSVSGSNFCHVSVAKAGEGHVAVFSVIDNLCKGGSGQAVQNMNVMMGLDEKMGLDFTGLGV